MASTSACSTSSVARSRAPARASSITSGRSSSATSRSAERSRASASAESRLALTDLLLQRLDALAQGAVLLLELAGAVAQRRVALPPVDAHLLGLVHGRDQQPQLDRQQLDVEQVDLDVARDDDALVEHALQDVGQ